MFSYELILVSILTALALIFFQTIITGVPPMSTSPQARSVLLDVIPPGLGGVVYELGSGWGGLARSLARQDFSSTVVACEVSLVPWAVSRLWCALNPLPNLTIERRNFFTRPLSDAAGVVCYLYPGIMKKLKSKLETELPDGAWVISNTFAVPGWKPERRVRVEGVLSSFVYLYRMPAEVSDYELPASSGIFFGHNP